MTTPRHCFYTIVRYVPDPIRDEAKNIGVIVVAPEERFARARFMLSRSQVPAGTRRHHLLRSIMDSYQMEMPGSIEVPTSWNRERLLELHYECTNIIQFSAPHVAEGDPQRVLNLLFQQRVQPKGGGGGSHWNRSAAITKRKEG